MNVKHFNFFECTKDDLVKWTAAREGEVKLGQCLQAGLKSNARFVVIGVQEDIGPQTNKGNGGAKNSFLAAITRFVNMQSNRFLTGEHIAIGGVVTQLSEFSSIEEGKKWVGELDRLLIDVLVPIYQQRQIPVLIGGGHNNAFPLIAAYHKATGNDLEVVNCDPHADCRRLEGRHSGNPFSYAKEAGYLSHYSVLGLHKAYNSESMLSYLDEKGFSYSFMDDYLENMEQFIKDVERITISTQAPIGVELDLDAIKHMPSSAFTPSGFELEQVRLYVQMIAKSKRTKAYLHLPEGAPINTNDEKVVGKALAYLMYDFLSNVK